MQAPGLPPGLPKGLTKGLDTGFPFFGAPVLGGTGLAAGSGDSPGIPVFPNGGKSVLNARFTTYLMCEPVDAAKAVDGVWVPVESISWSISVVVTWPKGVGAPVLNAKLISVVIAGAVAPFGPGQSFNFSAATEIPTWKGVVSTTFVIPVKK